MNGWERLGTALSPLVAVPSALLIHADNNSELAFTSPSYDGIERLTSREAIIADVNDYGALSDCIPDTIAIEKLGADHYSVACDNDASAWLDDVALAFALPFAFFFGLGWVIAWIRRGFKGEKT